MCLSESTGDYTDEVSVLLYNELVSLLFSYTLPGTTCINIPLNDSHPSFSLYIPLS